MPSFRPTVSGPGDAAGDEVIVVGRVYLDPPFREGEQKIAWGIGMDFFRNAYLGTGDTPWGRQELPDGDSKGILDDSIQVPFNQWFFARFPKRDFYVRMLMYYPDVESVLTGVHSAVLDQRRAYLVSDLKVDVKPTDSVIFIGTLIYQRDDFNNLKGVKVYGDLKTAASAMQKRLGSSQARVSLAHL
jgi:hypothetical protein